MSAGVLRPVSTLLHVLQCPSVRVLPHPQRRLHRGALLRLADVPALDLRYGRSRLIVVAVIPVTPLTTASVLLMVWRVRASLAVAGLLLHPAVVLLTQLR